MGGKANHALDVCRPVNTHLSFFKPDGPGGCGFGVTEEYASMRRCHDERYFSLYFSLFAHSLSCFGIEFGF